MLLQEPPTSQADLHFRLFGFPVRIHPFFWVIVVLLGISPGRGGGDTPPEALLIWVAVVLVSILVHELGHALAQRHFGGHPKITLHGFGGLASCDDCDRSPRSQILISLAGPGAGFALAAAVAIAMRLAGLSIGPDFGRAAEHVTPPYASLFGLFYWQLPANELASQLIGQLLFVNIVWGLVNLLPIYPLDGGQVSREVCTLNSPSRGIVLSLQISMVCAGAMAVFAAVKWESIFVAIMFGFFAYSNYRTLQAYQASRW